MKHRLLCSRVTRRTTAREAYGSLFAVVLVLSSAACSAPRPGDRLPRRGDEISVCGQLYHTGTKVVLWNDPRGYDAYRVHRHFDPAEAAPSAAPERTARYGSFRRHTPESIATRAREHGWTVDDLASVVSQIVIHFDACGTSRRCFEVLHDIRGLSCHFLLDLDGTIYQTLDVKERAWHAAAANDRSIGIEIANIGAVEDPADLEVWYGDPDGEGLRATFPDSYGETGLPDGFVARPVRAELQSGRINGRELVQYDFTEAQYVALERLVRTLAEIFPRIRLDAPRDASGQIRPDAFPTDEELHAFEGVVAHWHVTTRKVDPGPAFQWDRILAP